MNMKIAKYTYNIFIITFLFVLLINDAIPAYFSDKISITIPVCFIFTLGTISIIVIIIERIIYLINHIFN